MGSVFLVKDKLGMASFKKFLVAFCNWIRNGDTIRVMWLSAYQMVGILKLAVAKGIKES